MQAHILVCFLALALWRTLEMGMQGKGLGRKHGEEAGGDCPGTYHENRRGMSAQWREGERMNCTAPSLTSASAPLFFSSVINSAPACKTGP